MRSVTSFIRTSRRRMVVVVATAGIIALGGLGIAVAATVTHTQSSNSRAAGRGINEFGMTKTFYKGRTLSFDYTHGYYCDTSVSSSATSKCEAGTNYRKPPAKDFDPLYITVPLGFTEKMTMLECPASLVCVDHPGTIDLTRLEPALKPLYPQLSKSQLTAALKNFNVPGHNHFITTTNGGQKEWWDVKVIGVTSQAVYNRINQHGSYSYIKQLIKNKDKNVVGPIPTNLFLFFSVK